jgi:hypothetical protein
MLDQNKSSFDNGVD